MKCMHALAQLSLQPVMCHPIDPFHCHKATPRWTAPTCTATVTGALHTLYKHATRLYKSLRTSASHINVC